MILMRLIQHDECVDYTLHAIQTYRSLFTFAWGAALIICFILFLRLSCSPCLCLSRNRLLYPQEKWTAQVKPIAKRVYCWWISNRMIQEKLLDCEKGFCWNQTSAILAFFKRVNRINKTLAHCWVKRQLDPFWKQLIWRETLPQWKVF